MASERGGTPITSTSIGPVYEPTLSGPSYGNENTGHSETLAVSLVFVLYEGFNYGCGGGTKGGCTFCHFLMRLKGFKKMLVGVGLSGINTSVVSTLGGCPIRTLLNLLFFMFFYVRSRLG